MIHLAAHDECRRGVAGRILYKAGKAKSSIDYLEFRF